MRCDCGTAACTGEGRSVAADVLDSRCELRIWRCGRKSGSSAMGRRKRELGCVSNSRSRRLELSVSITCWPFARFLRHRGGRRKSVTFGRLTSRYRWARGRISKKRVCSVNWQDSSCGAGLSLEVRAVVSRRRICVGAACGVSWVYMWERCRGKCGG